MTFVGEGAYIIGRPRHLMNQLGKSLMRGAERHMLRGPYETRRGLTFEAAIVVDGEATGFIAKVTVELLPDRYDAETDTMRPWVDT